MLGSGGAKSARLSLQQELTHHNIRKKAKMVEYKCFLCNKNVAESYLKKKIRCPYCGSKILFKPRTYTSKIKAR